MHNLKHTNNLNFQKKKINYKMIILKKMRLLQIKTISNVLNKFISVIQILCSTEMKLNVTKEKIQV